MTTKKSIFERQDKETAGFIVRAWRGETIGFVRFAVAWEGKKLVVVQSDDSFFRVGTEVDPERPDLRTRNHRGVWVPLD